MGDRAIIILHNKKEVGVTIYTHWCGHDVPDFLEDLQDLMGNRLDDISYSSARLLQIIGNNTPGNLSTGVGNTPVAIEEALLSFIKCHNDHDMKALEDYGHGDAGLITFDVEERRARVFDKYETSYLEVYEDGSLHLVDDESNDE